MTNRRAYPAHIQTESERRMADDFRLFLWFLWRHLGLPEPTPVQYDIAVYIQRGPRRRIIQAFRGVGKSFITAAYVLWRLWRDPDTRVMVVSANEERAIAFSTFVRRLIGDVDMLRVLLPKPGARDSVKAFDVGGASADQAPSVRCVGVTGQMTGGRADVIVADDVEIPRNAATEREREKLAETVKEFDAVLKPKGEIIYLGTPQVTQSLYLTLEGRGYQCRVWPARYVQDSPKYRGNLAPFVVSKPQLVGTPVEPERFTEVDLAERESSYGRSGFALQFMLDTALSDADRYPLKIDDLVVMDVDARRAPVALTWAAGKQQEIPELPNLAFNGQRFHRPMWTSEEWAEYQGAVMTIDPSGRGKDETSYCVTKMLKGVIHVRRWGGLQGGYDKPTLETLARIAKEEGVKLIRYEANYGDGMFGALFGPVLTSIYPVALEEYKVSGQKEARIIDTLEPILNQHRLVVDRKVIEEDHKSTDGRPWYSGIYQLAHLTRDRGSLKNDDRLDALHAGVGYWSAMIQNDTAKAESEHKDKLMKLELRKFMKHVVGGKQRRRTWAGL